MPGLFAQADPIPATPPMHGLTASAAEATGPVRWELGFTVSPENCVDISGFDPDLCTAWPDQTLPKPTKSVAGRPLNAYDVMPFALESPFECDAQGFNVIDFQGRARRQLESATSKGLEHELWTADLKPENASLDNGATILGAGAPFGLLQGLALLGQALSNCAAGGRGMIHAPTFIVDMWLANHGMLLKLEATRIVTTNRGDVIVSGTGYPGTGEDGLAVALGSSWVYATGPVQYRLGETSVYPETVKEALNRKSNDIEYRAERTAAVNFDPCCHFGILIDPSI
jgi:hypothetical protein